MAFDNVTSDSGFNGNALDVNFDLIDPLNRKKMSAVAAYFRAEKRGFALGNDLEDWFEAEAEVNRHLNSFSS